jgi:hypothetical protein
MHGYFQLAAGASRETMLEKIAAPVVAAAKRTPLLLNFPMGWHMCRYMCLLMCILYYCVYVFTYVPLLMYSPPAAVLC